ncbi:DUF5684 domain-containing protein [Microbacterium sp. NPDC079995]|uniref:DUF5684 domain-containing protein n=1 Tax=unclassified Microbacterium TaxID=2609290 RepID=UPI00344ED1C3
MITGVDSGAGVVLGLLAVILGVAVYVWVALALSAAFRKMGEEPWRAWVPFLNIAILLRWGGFSMWLVLLALIPGPGTVAVWVLLILTVHRINPGFGYGGGMTVVGALLFPVWATIVGFGPADWRGARPAHLRIDPTARPASPPYAPFGSLAPDFGAPLPPPPLPGVEPTATDDSASRNAPAPAASVAPQPWAPEPAAAGATGEPAATPVASTRAEEQPDPTAPTPTLRSTSGWGAPRDAADPSSQVPFPPHAAPYDVSPPIAAAPGIISSVPGREEAPVTRLRPPAVGAERDEKDVFPELTGEVSAVPGSPAAGAPVSATSSVSAQERENREAAAASWDEDLERTVVVRRGHARWELVLPDGSSASLSSDVVILGRNPVADRARPGAQLLAIADPTRTVSKTHARLERRGETWRITDLGSTNGILLPNALGADVEVEQGGEAEVAERFLLGDAALRLQRTEAGS